MSEGWAGVGGKGTTHPFSQWDLRFCLQTRYRAGRKKHPEEGGGSGKDGGDTEQGGYRGAGGQEKGLQAQAGPPGWEREHREQRSGFQGRKDTKLRQWVEMKSDPGGAAMLATCSTQDSGRRVLQLFLSCCGEAPVVGVARTGLLENHPASCLPWPCGPARGMHVYSSHHPATVSPRT